MGCAKLEFVAEAFCLTVHTDDTIVTVVSTMRVVSKANEYRLEGEHSRSDKGQFEVNIVADVHHRRQNKIVQAVSCVWTLAHDVRFERNSSWKVFLHGLIVHQADSEHGGEGKESDNGQEAENDGSKDATAWGFCPC